MNILVKKSALSGTVIAPPSKSLTHRYLILAALALGKSIIKNPLICADTLHTINALKGLGVKITRTGEAITIHGTGGKFTAKNAKLFLGDSGTSLRLILAVAALCKNPVLIDGSKRLRKRPHKDLLEALENQGAHIKYLKNHHSIPLIISSKGIKGGRIKIPGNISSQFISALLMIAPFTRKKLEIEITGNIVSKGYIDLTLQAMRAFKHGSANITVEGDFSSASYFMALSLLSGSKIRIKNLNANSAQPDRIIADILKKPPNNLKIDISSCPDIALTLGILGPSFGITLKGTKRLADKESNRAETLVKNLKRLGAKIKSGKDFIEIKKSKLHAGVINTFDDHRVAMSFAVLGTSIKEGLIIKNAETVQKSYPNFFKDLKRLGANITIINN